MREATERQNAGRKVSSTCLVIEDRNRYSVPCELVGQKVSIRIYPERIDFAAHDAIVASHARCFERNQTRYDWQHYIPLIQRKPGALRNGAPFADMPEPLQRLRGLLLRHDGGDRVMAKVLAAVPQYGLESVLVAVELVLESGNPSVEHIENVLNRLKAVAPPEPVETHLRVPFGLSSLNHCSVPLPWAIVPSHLPDQFIFSLGSGWGFHTRHPVLPSAIQSACILTSGNVACGTEGCAAIDGFVSSVLDSCRTHFPWASVFNLKPSSVHFFRADSISADKGDCA